ncbi:hypothetical protein [Lacticaseibacillus parakribbianus]|uniref:hypothetical protein n=1 Tax=Lacticaseibacillus parakribbianus TaxID=2970927 RepID=UPI0021CB6A7E|nr:hypothetical protein [Lacticaseibacillus parakribbianus]
MNWFEVVTVGAFATVLILATYAWLRRVVLRRVGLVANLVWAALLLLLGWWLKFHDFGDGASDETIAMLRYMGVLTLAIGAWVALRQWWPVRGWTALVGYRLLRPLRPTPGWLAAVNRQWHPRVAGHWGMAGGVYRMSVLGDLEAYAQGFGEVAFNHRALQRQAKDWLAYSVVTRTDWTAYTKAFWAAVAANGTRPDNTYARYLESAGWPLLAFVGRYRTLILPLPEVLGNLKRIKAAQSRLENAIQGDRTTFDELADWYRGGVVAVPGFRRRLRLYRQSGHTHTTLERDEMQDVRGDYADYWRYVLLLGNGTLLVSVTNNPARRLKEQAGGSGSVVTRSSGVTGLVRLDHLGEKLLNDAMADADALTLKLMAQYGVAYVRGGHWSQQGSHAIQQKMYHQGDLIASRYDIDVDKLLHGKIKPYRGE